MSTATLTINLRAIQENWRALSDMSASETAAVVKADAYGLSAEPVAAALSHAGAKTFFVAVAEEGKAVRKAVGAEAQIFVFSGHMAGDTQTIKEQNLIPLLNSVDQMLLHFEKLRSYPFGLQLDSGMNRLGLEPEEWQAARDMILPLGPHLVMSHLSCADEPKHPMNEAQLLTFKEMTEGVEAPLSLAATGGIFLGETYHFDMTRPGVGLYGGAPFHDAQPVVTLSLSVIQSRLVEAGEAVGYGNSFIAKQQMRVATLSAGYADGLIRAISNAGAVLFDGISCPILGRVSMDLIAVDISALGSEPEALEILNETQTVDDLAKSAGTIGYEILTSLGSRYRREYIT